MNNVVLIGRWTKDITLNFQANSGLAVAKGILAVDRKTKKDGPKEADFISVTMFGKTAESTSEWCGAKGNLIGIKGHIQTGKYDKDGTTHYTTEVIVDETQFLEFKKSNNTAPAADSADEMTPVDDGDIPF